MVRPEQKEIITIKIQSLGYNVFPIKVYRRGQSKIYDILLATKNQTVSKVFSD